MTIYEKYNNLFRKPIFKKISRNSKKMSFIMKQIPNSITQVIYARIQTCAEKVSRFFIREFDEEPLRKLLHNFLLWVTVRQCVQQMEENTVIVSNDGIQIQTHVEKFTVSFFSVFAFCL